MRARDKESTLIPYYASGNCGFGNVENSMLCVTLDGGDLVLGKSVTQQSIKVNHTTLAVGRNNSRYAPLG